ncbi:MAG: hypothetical protein HYY18_16455, partial [Planctomycetes bacterium]|nr:hypothetical protein [Planctomycetota bacterium]
TPSGAPTASWFTLRLLNDLLSGAQPVPGELLPDVLTFKKDDRLILFVNPSTPRLLDAWLGDKLVRLDLLGRAAAVPTDAGGRQRIDTGTAPFFLVVSDTAFAETQLSGVFEGHPLKSRTSAQTVTFRLVNRFPEPIHNLRIVEAVLPPKWHPIDPALELTSVAPGAEARFPLEISLPSDVRPGDYSVRLKVSFSDGAARREATLTRVLTVRPEVDVLPRIEETADGKGLEVTVTVRNRGEKKTDFKIYVNRGNGARTLDEVVYGLEPGAERIVRFLAPKDESGREYVIGLRGIEDDLFVNEVVRVP